ncbi:hypothetical protein MSC49_28280 [Methylosinus sp. C49]|nr:hypothetical protein MSC49_28280 [Methylosinus sp. C49]
MSQGPAQAGPEKDEKKRAHGRLLAQAGDGVTGAGRHQIAQLRFKPDLRIAANMRKLAPTAASPSRRNY